VRLAQETGLPERSLRSSPARLDQAVDGLNTFSGKFRASVSFSSKQVPRPTEGALDLPTNCRFDL
jgi:hypothetical protein